MKLSTTSRVLALLTATGLSSAIISSDIPAAVKGSTYFDAEDDVFPTKASVMMNETNFNSELVSTVLLNQVEHEESWDRIKQKGSTRWDIYDKLGCEEKFYGGSQRPMPTQKMWKEAIEGYHALVTDREMDHLNDGFSVDIRAEQAQRKGRGIFANQPIKKGQLIWSTKRSARFEHGSQYRKFISMFKPDFACDLLEWSYVQDVGEEFEDFVITVDLDEGCLCNGEDADTFASMGCDEGEAMKFEGGCKTNYFALRDIEAGEEIICDYGGFAVGDGWVKFGL